MNERLSDGQKLKAIGLWLGIRASIIGCIVIVYKIGAMALPRLV